MQPPYDPDEKRGEARTRNGTKRPRAANFNLKAYFWVAFLFSLALVFIPLFLILAIPKIGDYWFDSASVQEVLEHGAAYGVEIGRTKEQTFEDLGSLSLAEPLIVSVAGLENGPRRFLLSDEVAHDILMRSDHWHLVFSVSTIDVLRLHFSDGKLSKIIRVKTPRMPPKRWGSLHPTLNMVA